MRRFVLVWSASALLGGCAGSLGGDSYSDVVGADELMRDVRVLAVDSMEGRRIGTAGSARARAFLVREFARAGLEPVGAEGFEQRFEHFWRRDGVTYRGTNVVGVISGQVSPERYVVVSAHYDHLGVVDGEVYNGADDNASGTAALLALARRLRLEPPAHSWLFVAFDGEEGPGAGARSFLRTPPVPLEAIVLNVNLDPVGRSASGALNVAGLYHYPFLRPYVDSLSAVAAVPLTFGHDRPDGVGGDDWTAQSDQLPFHERGIPFIYFAVEDHPDMHRPTDEVERLMPEFFADGVTTVLRGLRIFDRNLPAIMAASATRASQP